MRVRITSADGRRHPVDPTPVVLHLCILARYRACAAAIKHASPVQVLISEHADGELITQVCRWLGVGAIRGWSTRGGSQCVEMIRNSDGEVKFPRLPPTALADRVMN